MNKVILITGCSSGLGNYLAEIFAQKKYQVFAGIRKPEDMIRLRKIWLNKGLKITPVKLDITLDEDCRQVISKITSSTKGIDILINNAGSSLSGNVENFTGSDFQKILDINAVGPFRLIKEVLPTMKRSKRGLIVNISSLNGIVALPNFSLYSASKFALSGLTNSLQLELKGFGIRVINITPGAFKSQEKVGESLPHKPAREKIPLLGLLLPIPDISQIGRSVVKAVEDPDPSLTVPIGRDAQILIPLKKILPESWWFKLAYLIWKI